ncbi:MAG TPA: tetratricopeptide repeat protein, partial [Verrucomicrobiae bacterium]
DPQAGLAHTKEALRLDPNDGCAHFDLGVALLDHRQLDQAIVHLREAERLLPEGFDQRYSPPELNYALGDALSKKGLAAEAAQVLAKTVAADPRHGRAHYLLALSFAAQGRLDDSLAHYHTACAIRPQIDTSPELHFLLSVNYEKAGKFKEALRSAERALALAPEKGDSTLLNALNERVETCRERAR